MLFRSHHSIGNPSFFRPCFHLAQSLGEISTRGSFRQLGPGLGVPQGRSMVSFFGRVLLERLEPSSSTPSHRGIDRKHLSFFPAGSHSDNARVAVPPESFGNGRERFLFPKREIRQANGSGNSPHRSDSFGFPCFAGLFAFVVLGRLSCVFGWEGRLSQIGRAHV